MISIVTLNSYHSNKTYVSTNDNNRSNFLGTTFVIYSHGKNPMKKEGENGKGELPVREEMGAVLYVRII